ncbi:MAG: hypothetical protein ACI9BD_001187 [Candidatus Marinamargulisbacteria bacterium]|jgi:hypothetical protein
MSVFSVSNGNAIENVVTPAAAPAIVNRVSGLKFRRRKGGQALLFPGGDDSAHSDRTSDIESRLVMNVPNPSTDLAVPIA